VHHTRADTHANASPPACHLALALARAHVDVCSHDDEHLAYLACMLVLFRFCILVRYHMNVVMHEYTNAQMHKCNS
jgi:hypothetical protein